MKNQKPTIEELFALLSKAQIPHTTEDEMQRAIAQFLFQEGIVFIREYSLNKKDRVDFLTEGGTAIECKVKGQPLAVHRQLERYAESEHVESVLLVTSKFMKVRTTINGKRAMVVHVGNSWL